MKFIKKVFFILFLFLLLNGSYVFIAEASISSPTDISGIRLWLDASDVDGDGNSGNDPSNSTTIATWVDKSGNGKNVTQATGGFQPIFITSGLNSKPVITFIPTQYMQASTASDWNFLHSGTAATVFIVGKGTVSDSNTDFLISTGGSGSARGFSVGRCAANCGSGMFIYTSNGTGGFPIEQYPATAIPGSFGVWSIVLNSSTPFMKFYENGLLTASQTSYAATPSASNPGSPLTLGVAPDSVSRPLAGDIAEVIIYNRALTASERIDVQTYLQSKWAQPSTLSDSTAPVLSSFTSTTTNGTYGVGQRINVKAVFDENLGTGSTMTAVLDTGASVTLSTISTNTLSGTYTIAPGQTSSSLTVSSISSASILDKSDNTGTSYSVPSAPNNLADTTDLVIGNSSAPTAQVLLLAGQSNALGRATVSTISRTDATSNIQILDQNLSNFATLQLGTNQHWQNPTTEFGPEMGMAHAYMDQNPSATVPLFIVKYAIGNTQLATIAGSDWNSSSSGEYFDTMVTLMQSAFDKINTLGYTPDLRGLVWMQGENDGTSSTKANAYQTNLTNLISTLRSRINQSSLPIIVGKIRQDDPSAPFSSTVRTAEATVVNAGTNTCLIDGDDLTLFDSVHFDASSALELGKRFYNASKECNHTAPALSAQVISGSTLTLTFDKSLNTSVIPSGSAFVLRVNGSSVSLSNLSLSSTQLTATVATPVISTDTVTLAYTIPGSNPVQDWAGNRLATISSPLAVSNQTPASASSVRAHPVGRIILPAVIPVSTAALPVIASRFAFTRSLRIKSTGEEVRALQAYLNNHGFTITMAGPRSKGHEIEYFDVLTRATLMRFQKANNIGPFDGIFGPKTRNFINSHP